MCKRNRNTTLPPKRRRQYFQFIENRIELLFFKRVVRCTIIFLRQVNHLQCTHFPREAQTSKFHDQLDYSPSMAYQ